MLQQGLIKRFDSTRIGKIDGGVLVGIQTHELFQRRAGGDQLVETIALTVFVAWMQAALDGCAAGAARHRHGVDIRLCNGVDWGFADLVRHTGPVWNE